MKRIVFGAALAAALLALLWTGALAETEDGVYAPEGFTFSGGSGRIVIECPRVEIREGTAWATLVFSSPNYPWVQVDGVRYEGEHPGDTSVFVVPAPLNRSFAITGLTTAMSQPHEIEYRLFIRLGGSEALPGLTWESSLELQYAERFSVDRYQGGYRLISVSDGGRYLLVPEGGEAPEGLDPAITVIKKPLGRVYLAASAAMSLFVRLDALDRVHFSALEAEDWTVPEAAEAMAEGRIRFGGKYSQPDYELLVKEDCDLAVESTMILHAPKAQEMLEALGIPVFTDFSSYEPEPLGRAEWIKLYGVLTDREEEAGRFFAQCAAEVEALEPGAASGKTVVFFYISTDGSAMVRSGDDYIARSVELAGGTYLFADLKSDRSTVALSFEEFYDRAREADVLIYNATIDAELAGVEDLLERNPLLANFQAVAQGSVFVTDRSLYQATDAVGSLIVDLNRALNGDTEDLTFLTLLK